MEDHIHRLMTKMGIFVGGTWYTDLIRIHLKYIYRCSVYVSYNSTTHNLT